MNTRHMLATMMGAALLGGTAFAQADGQQAPAPRDDAPGMRPPCEGPGGCPAMRAEGQGGMQRGRPGQERGFGMAQERRGGQGGPQMQRGGQGPRGDRDPLQNPELLKKAGATDQQLETLKAFGFEQRAKRIDLQAAVEKAELALDQAMTATTLDEKAAMKAADALSQARGELAKLEIASRIKARQVLGDEVLKKLHEQRPPEGRPGAGFGPRPQGPEGKDAPQACGDRPQQPREQKQP